MAWHACMHYQALLLPEFEKEVEGVVNFEVMQDPMNMGKTKGFGFLTLKDEETCKATHAKYHKDKLQLMVRGGKEGKNRACTRRFTLFFPSAFAPNAHVPCVYIRHKICGGVHSWSSFSDLGLYLGFLVPFSFDWCFFFFFPVTTVVAPISRMKKRSYRQLCLPLRLLSHVALS